MKINNKINKAEMKKEIKQVREDFEILKARLGDKAPKEKVRDLEKRIKHLEETAESF